jgi:cytidine deaminase
VRDAADSALIRQVGELLDRLARPGRHHIAAGLLLENSEIVTAINLISNLGPGSLCAEQAALAAWAKSHRSRIMRVAAMRATFDPQGNLEIVSPCGRCRDLICEYAPDSHCIIPDGEPLLGYTGVSIADLLPSPFRRRRNAVTPGSTESVTT